MANDLLEKLQAYAKSFDREGEACPECNRGTGKEEVTDCDCCYNTGYITPEWFLNNNVLEIKHIVSDNFLHLGAILTLCMGGPNIDLHLSESMACLKGYWGFDEELLTLENTEFLRHLDFCVSEMFSRR